MARSGSRSSGGRKTPERPDMSPSSVYSDASTARRTYSGLNPVKIAARAIGSCFAPTETTSSKFDRDLDVSKAPSGILLVILNPISWIWSCNISWKVKVVEMFEKSCWISSILLKDSIFLMLSSYLKLSVLMHRKAIFFFFEIDTFYFLQGFVFVGSRSVECWTWVTRFFI